ncbi:translocation/assembly module TamB domain-containing protein [Tenacibaculum litopenaei]|uniref:translocation/assembly module TamB domain-containing protein n=1 Tax=Tenacibaculum litopenaei TaxID=396016 RepID=UPI0038B44337
MLFLLLLIVVLSLPPVQSRLAKKATDYVNEAFGTNIVVKRLDLSWLGTVQLKGIEIRDHHQDTLIFVKNLKTSLLNAKKVLENKVDLGEASLSGIHFHMKTYKGESNDNLSVFIESFDDNKPKDSTATPFILRCEQINLADMDFRLRDENRSEDLQFGASKLSASLNNFAVVGPDVNADIRNMGFTDNRGVVVTDLSTDFSYTKTKMLFNNLVLRTDNNSKLAANVKLSYNRKDFVDFNDKVQIKATFNKSSMSVKDLSKLYRELSGDDMLHFTGKIQGVLNNFSATKVRLHSKNGMKIIGDMGFVNALRTERGFVFDADLANVTANYFQLKSVLPNLLGKTLPTEFQRLGNFTMVGLVKVTPEQMEATLNVESAIGTTISDLQLTNIENIDEAEYVGEVEFKDFDIGVFANDPLLGKISLIADVNGSGFNVENVNTTIIGKITNLEFNDYEYKDLSVNGQFQNKKFDGFLSADDENFKMTFEGLADFSSAINKFDFEADIAHVNLKATNLFTRDSIARLKGKVGLNISGNTFDDIIGKASFKDFVYTNQKQAYRFKKFDISSIVKDSIKTIEVNSEDIVRGKLEGKFLFNELWSVTQNALGSVYTNYEPFKVTPNQFLDFDFTIYNQIIDVFLPQMSIGKNTRLKGRINSDRNSVKLTFSTPVINAYGNLLETVVLRLDNKNALYNTHLTAGKIDSKYYDIEKLNLLNRTEKDTLFFKSLFNGGKNFDQKFNFDFYFTINPDQKWVVGVQKSTLNYQGFDWVVNPNNDKESKVTFDLQKKDFSVAPVELISGEQHIGFRGDIKGEDYKDIQASFRSVKLQSFLPSIDSLRLRGKVDGLFALKQKEGILDPKAEMRIQDFSINDFEQGNLSLQIKGENSFEKYSAYMSLENENAKSITAQGTLDFSQKRPTMDLSVALRDYEIAAFSPLGQEVLSKLRGRVSGDFTSKGYIRNPEFDGKLVLEEAGLAFPYLNVDFDLKGNSEIVLEGQQFILSDVILEDTKHNTVGNLSGYIAHRNFDLWFMDLDLTTDNLLVLDTKESDEIPYYGTAFLKGTAEITGVTSNLDIVVEGSTQPNTKFVIPLSDVKMIDNYKLIHFEKRATETVEKEKLIEDIKGLDLKMRLDVTKDAEAQVVIDKVSGSELKGSGQGTLQIDINTRGKFNMFGDFKVEKGLYNFKYAGITKPFVVQKGGTISWTGSPFDAELDITAVYRTKANPAQVLDNINSSRKIPIDLYTKITGGLFSSKQEFDIKIPNANSTVSSELEFLLNENDLNTKMQHFSFLLAFGTFYNEEAIGTSATNGLTGTASEIATSILSDMLNSDGSKVKFGVGYTQGNRGDVNNVNSDDQVDVSVSTQLSDRVLVNGKVGVPVGANTQTSVVGEVKVEVLLNEEGNFRGTVFNRQNDVQYSAEDEGYTQGVGLSYQVNFNNLKELGQKLGLKKKEKKEAKKDSLPKKPKNRMMHFKSKKKTKK